VSAEQPEGLAVGPGWYRCGPNGDVQKPKPEYEDKDPDSIPDDGWVTVGTIPVSGAPPNREPFHLSHDYTITGFGRLA